MEEETNCEVNTEYCGRETAEKRKKDILIWDDWEGGGKVPQCNAQTQKMEKQMKEDGRIHPYLKLGKQRRFTMPCALKLK